ncbi:MAG: hypothetical protein M9928_20635 [Anaerolineae bacterium]|nr:hypothetical protein [Anaerolineae bacterium]MCO5207423.1 hypothetical protein [Anaerolineae bacterium]
MRKNIFFRLLAVILPVFVLATVLLVVSFSYAAETSVPSTGGVAVSADATTKYGLRDDTVTYNLTVTNTGTLSDSFGVFIEGETWMTESDVFGLNAMDPDEIRPVVISVTVGAGASDTVTITVKSFVDPMVRDSVLLTTIATTPDVEITSPNDTQSGTMGNTVTYTLNVRNTGNQPDSFDLSVSNNSWATTLSDSSVGPLDPDESVAVEAYVVVGSGMIDMATISAESTLDSDVSDSIVLNTLTFEPGVAIDPDKTEGFGYETESVKYRLTISNTGEMTDTYGLVFGEEAWETVLSASLVGPVVPDSSQVVTVTVVVPVGGISDTVNVTATSAFVGTVYDTVSLTTTALHPGVDVSTTDADKAGMLGEVVTYMVDVKNTGNVSDTYAITVSGQSWMTALSQTSVGPLAPGASSIVIVSVTVGTGSTTDTATIRAQSAENASIFDQVNLTSTRLEMRKVYLPIVLRKP